MTAEERLAYFQGKKHRGTAYGTKENEKNTDLLFFKIRFFISVLLFISFLSMDYTGYKVRNVGSQEIVQRVVTDMKIPEIQKLR